MSCLARCLLATLALASLTAPALAEEPRHGTPGAAPAAAPAERCPHGVKKALCARCNPKLVPVYKAKKDWCAEHERPESQCVLCHPALAKQGIK